MVPCLQFFRSTWLAVARLEKEIFFPNDQNCSVSNETAALQHFVNPVPHMIYNKENPNFIENPLKSYRLHNRLIVIFNFKRHTSHSQTTKIGCRMSIKKDDRASQKHTEYQQEPSAQNEGAFKRPNFAKTVTSLIGNNVKVKTKNGSTYEGNFSTLSSDLDVVVGLSHAVQLDDPFYDRVVNGSIVFKPEDIVSISCVNVNLKDALDLSQMLDFAGDFSTKKGELWEEKRKDSETFDKGWTDLLRDHKGHFDNNDFTGSYSSIYMQSDFGKASELENNIQAFNDMTHQKCELKKDYPKPQRMAQILPDGGPVAEGYSGSELDGKTSNLNPYAKPFTPLEVPSDKECGQIPPLAAVVLPTYLVPGNSPSKLEGGPQGMSGGGTASLLGGGSLQNQYMQYPYGDYDEKLYSSYDSLPITAHDYQQYYPHLQYIQYFRRFY